MTENNVVENGSTHKCTMKLCTKVVLDLIGTLTILFVGCVLCVVGDRAGGGYLLTIAIAVVTMMTWLKLDRVIWGDNHD